MLTPIAAGTKQSAEVKTLLETILSAEKALNWLTEIEKAEAAMIAERNQLTKAKDLDKALEKARQTQEKADRTLSDALDHAARVKNDANTETARLMGQAKAEAHALMDEAEALKAKAVSDYESVAVIKDQAEQELRRAETERSEVRAQKAECTSLQAELSEKLAKLKAITG